MSQPITLDIAGKDYRFEPNMIAYNGFINEMAMDNKNCPCPHLFTPHCGERRQRRAG